MKEKYQDFLKKKPEWEELSAKGGLRTALADAVDFTKGIPEFTHDYTSFTNLNGNLLDGGATREFTHTRFFEHLRIMEKEVKAKLEKLDADIPIFKSDNPDAPNNKKGCGVLILANPKESYPLRIEEEIVVIDRFFEVLKKNNSIQDRANIIGDFKVFRELDKYPPSFLHFIGHGNEEGDRIIFQNEMGKHESYSSSELISYFKSSNARVKIQLAFFNSCNSVDLAKKMTEFAEYAIGWENKVDDIVAIEFAESFYVILTNRLENDQQQPVGVAIEGAFNSAKAMFGFDFYSKTAEAHLFKH